MEKITKAVIPAAGWGTRFFPITKALPKEMIPVVDKPVIQYVVEEAVASGCDDILIITGKNKRAIEDHFDSNAELNAVFKNHNNKEFLKKSKDLEELADIHYVRQKEQLGLGHAILCAKKHVGDDSFAVLLGDTICVPDKGNEPCTAQLCDIAVKYQQPVIGVEIVPSHKIQDYGIIDGTKIDDGIYQINKMIEKPNLTEAPSNIGAMGRYVLTSEIFDFLKETKPGRNNEIQLTDALSNYKKYLGVITKNTRYDVGDIETWIVSNLKLLMKNEKYAKLIENIKW